MPVVESDEAKRTSVLANLTHDAWNVADWESNIAVPVSYIQWQNIVRLAATGQSRSAPLVC